LLLRLSHTDSEEEEEKNHRKANKQRGDRQEVQPEARYTRQQLTATSIHRRRSSVRATPLYEMPSAQFSAQLLPYKLRM
jgi:hypothetical protein